MLAALVIAVVLGTNDRELYLPDCWYDLQTGTLIRCEPKEPLYYGEFQ